LIYTRATAEKDTKEPAAKDAKDAKETKEPKEKPQKQQKAPKDIRNVVDYLRSSKAGMKTRVGVLNGKRVDFFKGKAAVKAVLSPTYAKKKNVPKVTNEEEAVKLLNSIIPFAFYLRVDQQDSAAGSGSGGKAPKPLTINQAQAFVPGDRYAWFYEGPMWTTYVGGVAMVVAMLAAVMFPLWPPILRMGVWYLSIGVLGLVGLFMAIAVVRLIFYIITVVVVSPGIWIFPKLFADVGVIESFIPFWEWDLPKKKKSKKRDVDSKGKGKAKGKSSGTSTPLNGGGAFIEEVETSGESRPTSRTAHVVDGEDDS